MADMKEILYDKLVETIKGMLKQDKFIFIIMSLFQL